MRLLLDTHVVLWQLGGVRELGARTRQAIATAVEVAVSVVSFAEIGVKAAVGKLVVPDGLGAHVHGAGLRVLALSADHGLAVATLPLHHRDPFDRLIIAQVQHEGFALVSADVRLRAYDIAVLDPRE